MLRSLVLILLIVNAAFFAWSQGWLNQLVGVQPNAQHEPQRLGQQVHADKIVVLAPPGGKAPAPAAASSVNAQSGASAPASAPLAAASATSTATSTASNSAGASPASAPGAAASATPLTAAAPPASKDNKCIEAGPFNATEYAAVEASLRPLLPPGSWGSHTVAIQGLWLAYMGPYADADMLSRKQAELRRIKGLNFEEVRTPANLALGISLGRYNKLEDAEAGLTTLRNRGIRTARIVNIRPHMEVQVLRVPRASVGMQVTLASIKLPQGKGFSPCRP